MSAAEAAEAIARGIRKVLPEAKLILLPLSDGGEGLVNALVTSGRGIFVDTKVTGPLGNPVKAKWGIIENGEKAVIEMAAASGLDLVPQNKRDPSVTTTFGTGELINAALDRGCGEIIIGIGGSATNDGGAGMAQALGAKFLDARGNPLQFGGAALKKLDTIDLSGIDQRLRKTKILVASDVDNPLTGIMGASRVYGPQKGASQQMADDLDSALNNYAAIIKNKLGTAVDQVPGAGAAGGMGAGLIAFLGAKLQPGIELVLETLNIDNYLDKCQLLITGEGKLDQQSLHGKVPVGVARRAKKRNLPVIVLAGSISGQAEYFHREGLTACFTIADGPLSLKESQERGPVLLEIRMTELMRLIICFTDRL